MLYYCHLFFVSVLKEINVISFWPWKASKNLEPSLIQEPEEPADAKAKPKAPFVHFEPPLVTGNLPGCLPNPEIMPLKD